MSLIPNKTFIRTISNEKSIDQYSSSTSFPFIREEVKPSPLPFDIALPNIFPRSLKDMNSYSGELVGYETKRIITPKHKATL